ncbi:MAG TPA: nucleotidyltransferase family protein [Bacteroidales bacterium]|nr:nucleotidyltransferase family protein [Bacteroidales bacterium]
MAKNNHAVMKAMIFAAGLGTRLQPLSNHTPKALIAPAGKPMLQLIAEKLIKAGVNNIVINIHHHHEKVLNFVSGLRYPGVTFSISDESNMLLDTGGGLLKARHLLEGKEPVILHNVDILSDVDLAAMLRHHLKCNPLATLAVCNRDSDRVFLWNGQQLAGWENTGTGQKILCTTSDDELLKPMAFSGIHIISPKIFSLITETGIFSLTPLYLRLAKEEQIIPFEHNPERWIDIGTPGKIQAAQMLIEQYPNAF